MEQTPVKDTAKETIRSLMLIVIGSLIEAVAMRAFLIPCKIAPGGVSGLATVIHYVTGLNTGMLILLMNAPLFLVALFVEGKKYLFNTLVAVVSMSLLTDLLPLSPVTDNLMLAALLGGAILGYGLGLIIKAGGNSGGTSLIAQMFTRLLPHISVAWLMFAVDFLVVALSAIVFSIEITLYALIALYVSSKVIDRAVEGFAAGKSIYVVTDKADTLAKLIMAQLDRGCTRLMAQGMYSGQERSVLLCVLKTNRELVQVKRLIKMHDAGAFVFTADVREVMGEGFVRAIGH